MCGSLLSQQVDGTADGGVILPESLGVAPEFEPESERRD
jgi:hypothetical protein